MKIIRLVVIGSVVCAALPAAAQINPFQGSRVGLTQQDVKLLSESIDRLNRSPNLSVGARDSWDNPNSRSRGENTVTQIFQQNGLSCHKMRNTITVKGRQPARVYNLDWCLGPDGSWKIHS